MELWSEIRRRVLAGEISMRQACSEYHLNFRTVGKIVRQPEPDELTDPVVGHIPPRRAGRLGQQLDDAHVGEWIGLVPAQLTRLGAGHRLPELGPIDLILLTNPRADQRLSVRALIRTVLSSGSRSLSAYRDETGYREETGAQ